MDARGDERAVFLGDIRERTLDAVKNIFHDAGAQRFGIGGSNLQGALRWAESGAPVPLTGSPTSRPVVFSYTWMVVRASLTLMTSPMRPAFPTYTISAMPNVLVSFTVTTGPLIE